LDGPAERSWTIAFDSPWNQSSSPERKASFKQIEQKVHEKLAEELLNRERAGFVRAFRSSWLARTSCKAAYVVSRCRQWHGTSVLVSEDPYTVR
jgi:hypothetical protein